MWLLAPGGGGGQKVVIMVNTLLLLFSVFFILFSLVILAFLYVCLLSFFFFSSRLKLTHSYSRIRFAFGIIYGKCFSAYYPYYGSFPAIFFSGSLEMFSILVHIFCGCGVSFVVLFRLCSFRYLVRTVAVV